MPGCEHGQPLRSVSHFHAWFVAGLPVDLLILGNRTPSRQAWENLESSGLWRDLLEDTKDIVVKREIHRSQAFNGHIDQEPPIGR